MTTLPQTTNIQLPRPVGASPLAAPMPPSFAGPGQVGMTGSDVWRVIRTNLWLIIGSVVVAGAIGVGLNAMLLKYDASYTSTGYVQVQQGKITDPLGKLPTNFGDTDSLSVELRTQATMLHHDGLFNQVLSNPNFKIRDTEWFKHFKKPDGSIDLAAAKEDLAMKFSANAIGDSKLIAVSFSARNAKDCSTVVQDVVNQHIENQRRISYERITSNQTLLSNMVVKYQNHIRELRNDTSLKQAKLQLDGWGRPGGVSQKEQELSQLITQRLKAESEASAAQGAYDGAMQQLQQGQTPAAVQIDVERGPQVSYWRNQVDNTEVSLRSLRSGQNSSVYADIARQLDANKDKLNEVRASETATSTDNYLDQLRSAASGTQHDLEAVNKQIDKIRNDLSEMTNDLTDYLTKKDEELSYAELLTRVRDQLEVLQNHSTSIDLNSVGWMGTPETPDAPSFPQFWYTVGACIACGLGLSLGISFLREVMDTSVRSPRDIARVGQMNLLGMIPHESDDPQAEGVPLSTVIYGAPTSMLAEQFRQVRTRLQHTASLDTTRSILVTSPGPEDGKTTIACNLAAGLALNGRKILLVDANFRRPELHKLFEVSNDTGFGTALSSIENFEGAIQKTKVPNLDVMPAGPKPANATELLESQLLIDFIERALEEYDHVIFDSGPMLVVSETVALAPRVDGVVTVVRARSNSRGLLQRMKETLRQLKAEHLGVILNGVRSTGGGYYGRNIKTYYEYSNGQPQ